MKVRQSNIEVLRIVAMLLIVMFHSVIQTVIGPAGEAAAKNVEFIGVSRFMMSYFGNLGVTLFAMISGYFLISSSTRVSPFKRASDAGLKFAGMILYNGIIVAGAIVLLLKVLDKFGVISISIDFTQNVFLDANSIFAFAGGYWYLSAYFILLVFLQPLNKWLQKLDTNVKYFSFLVMVIFLSTLVNYIPVFTVRDSVNFPLVFIGYILGGYIRLYDPLKNFKSPLIWIAVISFVVYFFGAFEFLTRILHVAPRLAEPAVGYYVGWPVYVLSALIFTLFTRLKIQSKFINAIAPATVFVYIFHTATPFNIFYLAADKIYDGWLITNFHGPLAALLLPLAALTYSLILLGTGTILYFVYNFFSSKFIKWVVTKVEN